MHNLIPILLKLAGIGLATYLILLIPMEETIKKAIKIVVLVAVVFWLLRTVVPMVNLG